MLNSDIFSKLHKVFSYTFTLNLTRKYLKQENGFTYKEWWHLFVYMLWLDIKLFIQVHIKTLTYYMKLA